jgi:pimeloyl-ACP methyl ester carboxylesterase
VAALLRYVNVDKADFFGFSNGGTTTLQIAVRHPAMVNKMILVSTIYKREGMVPGFFDGFPDATLADMPEPLKAAYLKVAPDKNHLQVMFDKDVARMANFKDMADDDLRSIKVPALIMVTDHDVIMPEHAIKIARLMPDAQVVILPGVHGACIGAAEADIAGKGGKLPEITATLIQDFLNG